MVDLFSGFYHVFSSHHYCSNGTNSRGFRRISFWSLLVDSSWQFSCWSKGRRSCSWNFSALRRRHQNTSMIRYKLFQWKWVHSLTCLLDSISVIFIIRRVRFTYLVCLCSNLLACLSLAYQDVLPSPSFQKRFQEDDQQSIPGEWDEFDKARPISKGADNFLDETKNSFDNPDQVGDKEDVGNRGKKEVQNQIQESNTQMSFKVNCRTSGGGIFCLLFKLEPFKVTHFNKQSRYVSRVQRMSGKEQLSRHSNILGKATRATRGVMTIWNQWHNHTATGSASDLQSLTQSTLCT